MARERKNREIRGKGELQPSTYPSPLAGEKKKVEKKEGRKGRGKGRRKGERKETKKQYKVAFCDCFYNRVKVGYNSIAGTRAS